jgi:predicted HicB family RNase H-like nuclease
MEKRVNIQLSEELHAKAKIISVLKKIPLNVFLSEAIDNSVKEDKAVIGKLE